MNDPLYSISHVHHIKIQKEANATFGQLQIRKHLRSVYRGKAVNRLDLDNHRIGNQEIQSKPRFEAQPVVGDRHFYLPSDGDRNLSQLMLKARLIEAFEEARAKLGMYSH